MHSGLRSIAVSLFGLLVLLWIFGRVLPQRVEGFNSQTDVLQRWLRHVQDQRNLQGEGSPEVFQVGPSKFTLENAQERCKRYGGRLATLEEVKGAHRKGGHWCRKGWIADGRVAVVKGLTRPEEDCPQGEPGVYTETYPSALRFAATCFGPRPRPGAQWQDEVERRRKEAEEERVRRESASSVQFVATLQQQMEQDQKHKEDMLRDEVAPFNRADMIWSQGV